MSKPTCAHARDVSRLTSKWPIPLIHLSFEHMGYMRMYMRMYMHM